MRIPLNILPYLLKTLLFGLLLCSCGSNQNEADESKPPVLQEGIAEFDNDQPQFEEVLPDSGLMENINPEEIITDDWTSGSPDAEATED